MYYTTIKEIEERAIRLKLSVIEAYKKNKNVVIVLSNGIRIRVKDF